MFMSECQQSACPQSLCMFLFMLRNSFEYGVMSRSCAGGGEGGGAARRNNVLFFTEPFIIANGCAKRKGAANIKCTVVAFLDSLRQLHQRSWF